MLALPGLSDTLPPCAVGGSLGVLTAHLNAKNNTSKWAQTQSLDIFLAMYVSSNSTHNTFLLSQKESQMDIFTHRYKGA